MTSVRSEAPRGILAGQFLSFCAVGAGGFVVDAGVLALALNLVHLDAYSGRVISYLAAATFTWLLNRRFTFASRSRRLVMEWARYVLTGAVGGLTNFAAYSAVVALVNHANGATHLVVSLAPYIGVAVGSAIGLLVNFTLARKIVFQPGR